MAIPAYKPREEKIGTGLLSSYTFDFKVISKDQILLIHTDENNEIIWIVRGDDVVVLTSVVLGPSPDGGGTVNLTAPLPLNHNLIIIQSEDAPTQPKRMKEKTGWTLKDMESALDFLGVEIQSLSYKIGRAMLMSDVLLDSAGFDHSVPPPKPDSVLIAVGPPGAPTHFEWIHRDAFKGEQGDMGPAGEIISTVVTSELEYDDPTPMSITNVGSFSQAALEFVLRKGPPGPAGESTVLWTSLPSVPDNSVGADGDIWLDTGSSPIGKGDLYQKESGAYVLKTNIVGPAGGLNSLDTEQGDILFDFSGLYSARFGKIISATTLRDSIRDIYDIQYVSPSVVLTSSAGTGTRERGNALTAMTLNAAVVRRSNDIAQLEFRQGGVSLDVQTSGPAIPGGGNQSFNWTGNITDTTTFSAIATDVPGGGGPTTGTGSVTINFVFPRYSDVGAPGLNAAAIVGLTKTIAVPSAAQRVDYNLAVGEVPYFAYPVTYGALAQISDENGFDATTSFTRTTRNLTNSFGVTVSCYVYEFNNPAGAANSTFYTFRR